MLEERWFYVYIMASRSRNLYTGLTSGLRHRVWQHKTRALGGFTARYNIDRLVYFERFNYVNNAIDRERQIHRWSRKKKLALIEEMNPTWLDLSEGWFGNAGPSTPPATAGSARDDNPRKVRSTRGASSGKRSGP
jgi:putative endonuclease